MRALAFIAIRFSVKPFPQLNSQELIMLTVRLATPSELSFYSSIAYPSENWVIVDNTDSIAVDGVFPNESSADAFLMGV